MDILFKHNEIIFDKELNELDKFVFDFVKILEKHTDYIIVSGYVAILFGRARATEDIDITIPKFSKEKFIEFHKAVVEKGYWFLNAESMGELYSLLETKHSVRIAKQGKAIPNFEIRFVKSDSDLESFKNKIKVNVSGNTIFTSPIELQIAYKEVMLGTNKDLADALHLRELFKEHINKKLLENYIKFLRYNKEHGKY